MAIFFSVFAIPFTYGQGNNLTLNGKYLGKNVYVENPYTNKGDSFCITKVVVNGKKVPHAEATAIVIALDSIGFKIGDSISIVIEHKSGCQPKILNQMVDPKSTFDVIDMSIDSAGVLKWKTKNETGKLVYIIEQYCWNKWIKVGEVDGKGSEEINEYSFQAFLHSGKNEFRVRQDAGGIRYSHPVEITAVKPAVKVLSYSFRDKVEFSHVTMFELYDDFGNLVKKGTGKEINCNELKRGDYFLDYDDQTTELIKQ